VTDAVTIGHDNLRDLIRRGQVEASVDTGVADDTSSLDTLEDSSKSWPVDAFANLIVDIMEGTGAGQIRKIASNTATRLTVATPFSVAPDATSRYRIGFFGKMAGEVTHWGGTAQSGADLTPLLENLDTALSDFMDNLRAMYEVCSAYNASIAAPLTVDLDTGPYGGRTIVEIWVSSSAAATFTVYGSRDNAHWREVDSITLTGASEAHQGYSNAYRYIRVSTADANDNEIEITASR